MFDISTARQVPGRFADRLFVRRHRSRRPMTEDERREVYTDLATLLAAADNIPPST